MNVHKLIVNYDKDPNINNIEVSKIDKVNPFVKKIYFYNPLIDEPLHKFWYCIKNAKIISNLNNCLEIVVSSSEDKLVSSLKSLDNVIDKTLKKVGLPTPSTSSIITSSNYPPRMSLIVDSNSVLYDKQNSIQKVSFLKKTTKVVAYIELDSISFAGSKISRVWRVVQLKEEAPIDLSTCLFLPQPSLAPIPPQNPYFMQGVPIPPPNPYLTQGSYVPPPPPPVEFINQKTDSSKEGSNFRPPTTDQLKDMIGKLKKRESKENNIAPANKNTCEDKKTSQSTIIDKMTVESKTENSIPDIEHKESNEDNSEEIQNKNNLEELHKNMKLFLSDAKNTMHKNINKRNKIIKNADSAFKKIEQNLNNDNVSDKSTSSDKSNSSGIMVKAKNNILDMLEDIEDSIDIGSIRKTMIK